MRVTVLLSAVFYNLTYKIVLAEWVLHLIDSYFQNEVIIDDKSNTVETIDIILHLMTGYNIVLHWPAWILNSLIIFKEW